MSGSDSDEIFLELFEAAKEYVPEADHLELCTKLLRTLAENGFDVRSLHGEDEIVDAALDEILESYDEYDEDDY